MQHFAVFLALHLQTQNSLQYLYPEGFECPFGDDKQKQSVWKPMLLFKKIEQGQARRIQQWIPFSNAPRNNIARIHLFFWFQKVLLIPHSRYAAHQPATA